MDNTHTHTPTGSPGRRLGHGRRVLTAGIAAFAGMATLVTAAATATPASAATVNGIATIASPGTTTPLLSGGSATQFTVSLPPQAACSGDTATNGYHVYSYLVHKGVALSGITFIGDPSAGLGLFDPTGTYYGPVNTAIGTGQIVGIPNNFEWAPIIAKSYVPLTGSSGLLYTGSGTSASGIWEAGIVCANTSGVPVDNWNTEVTFAAKASDTNGFNWSAVPGPSGSAPAAITSAASATFTEGASNTFTPTATGTPTPVITETGSLPAGVTFSGGVLSGTPTVTGTFPITFTATNGIESPATQSFTLTVNAAAGLHITTTSLPTVHLNVAYSAALTVTGATTAVKWTTNVKLPKGLKLNKTTGAISGKASTKDATGSFPITFTVTDKAKPTKHTASATLTLTVVTP